MLLLDRHHSIFAKDPESTKAEEVLEAFADKDGLTPKEYQHILGEWPGVPSYTGSNVDPLLVKVLGRGAEAEVTPDEQRQLFKLGYSKEFVDGIAGLDGLKALKMRARWLSCCAKDKRGQDINTRLAAISELESMGVKAGEDALPVLMELAKAPLIEQAVSAAGLDRAIVTYAPWLVPYYKADDSTSIIRAAAMHAIRKMGYSGERTMPILFEALQDDHEVVRFEAAYALGATASQKNGGIDALIQAATYDHSHVVQIEAIKALAARGSEADRAMDVFFDKLNDNDPEVRRAAAFAVGKIGKPTPAVLGLLEEKLEDPDADVRAMSAKAIGKFGSRARDCAKALTSLINDPVPEASVSAINALAELEHHARPAFSQLLAMLEAENASVRAAAVRAIGRLGLVDNDAKKAASAISPFLKDPALWPIAVESLGLLGPDAIDAVPLMLACAKEDENGIPSKVLETALRNILSSLDEKKKAQIYFAALDSPDEHAVKNVFALQYLFCTSPEILLGIAASMISDKNPAIQAGAIRALTLADELSPEIVEAMVPEIVEAMNSPDRDVCVAAALLLEKTRQWIKAITAASQPERGFFFPTPPWSIAPVTFSEIPIALRVEINDASYKRAVGLLSSAIDNLDVNPIIRAEAAILLFFRKEKIAPDQMARALACALLHPDIKIQGVAIEDLKHMDFAALPALPDITKLVEKGNFKMAEWNLKDLISVLKNIGRPAIPMLTMLLSSKDDSVVIGVMDVLAGMKSDAQVAAPKIVEILRDKNRNSSIRRDAAYALGKIGGQEALAALKEAVTDKNIYVGINSVEGLGSMGIAAREVAPMLAKIAKKTSDYYLKRAAICALGKIGGQVAFSTLKTMLSEYKDEDKYDGRIVRAAVINALGDIGVDAQEIVPEIVGIFRKGEFFERKLILHSLGKIGGPEALSVLKEEVVAGKNWELRVAALEGLGEMKDVPEDVILMLAGILNEHKDATQQFERDKNYNIKKAAACALGKNGSEKALSALERAVADRDIDTSVAAIHGLGEMKSAAEKVAPMLVKIFKENSRPLGKIKEILIDSDNCQQKKLAAIAALGEIGGPLAISALKAAYDDEDRRVREVAYDALHKL